MFKHCFIIFISFDLLIKKTSKILYRVFTVFFKHFEATLVRAKDIVISYINLVNCAFKVEK